MRSRGLRWAGAWILGGACAPPPAADGGDAARPGVEVPPPPTVMASLDQCPADTHWDGERCLANRCGTGLWGLHAPPAGAVFVQAGRSDGQGTADAPFGTLEEGLAAISTGGTLLLAEGVYSGNIIGTEHDLAVWGRCPELVQLAAGTTAGVVAYGPADVDIRGLHIGGQHHGVLALGGRTTLADVQVHDTVRAGVAADGADTFLGMDGVDIDGVDFDPEGWAGQGLLVQSGARVQASGLRVHDVGTAGVALSGSEGVFDDVEISSVRPSPAHGESYGFDMWGGAQAEVSGLRISGVPMASLFVSDSTVTVVDLDVTGPVDEGPPSSVGVMAVLGAQVSGAQWRVTDLGFAGVYIEDSVLSAQEVELEGGMGVGLSVLGGQVDAEDWLIRGVRKAPGRTSGWGILAAQGGVLHLADSHVSGCQTTGIQIEEAEVRLENIELGPAGYSYEASAGRGISVDGPGQLEALGLVIDGRRNAGIYLAAGHARLRDVMVSGTRPDRQAFGGTGIALEGGATLNLSGAQLIGNELAGLYLEAGPVTWDAEGVPEGPVQWVVSDVDIQQTGVGISECAPRGLSQVGGRLVAADIRLEDNHTAGWLISSQAHAELSDISIRNTQSACDGVDGFGMAVMARSVAYLDDAELSDNHVYGLVVQSAGAGLTDVSVRDTRRAPGTTLAQGIVGYNGAVVLMDGGGVWGTEGPGVSAFSFSDVVMWDTTISGNQFAGIMNGGATVWAEGITVEHTAANPLEGGGFGIVNDGEVYIGGWLGLYESTVADNHLGALYLAADAQADVWGSELSGGPGVAVGAGRWGHGDAIFAVQGAQPWRQWTDHTTGIRIDQSVIRDSSGAGLFLDDAGVELGENTWRDNGVDLHMQRCGAQTDALRGVEDQDWDGVTLCPEYELIFELLDFSELEEDVLVEP